MTQTSPSCTVAAGPERHGSSNRHQRLRGNRLLLRSSWLMVRLAPSGRSSRCRRPHPRTCGRACRVRTRRSRSARRRTPRSPEEMTGRPSTSSTSSCGRGSRTIWTAPSRASAGWRSRAVGIPNRSKKSVQASRSDSWTAQAERLLDGVYVEGSATPLYGATRYAVRGRWRRAA